METDRRTPSQDAGRMHRESMRRILLQRIETAKANNDQRLLEQLEQERRTLGL